MAKKSARAIAITGGTSGIACDVADEVGFVSAGLTA